MAQRVGDPAPDTLAPLVVIVNPMHGAVVSPHIRVQARVQHPSGLGAIASISVSLTGATTSTVALSANGSYSAGADTGVYEATVDLVPGSTTLVATAQDDAGRSTTSASVTVTANAGLGDGNLLVRDNSSQLCSACHAFPDHGSERSGRSYGAWTTTCRDCHAPHRTRNTTLVRESIRPPWVTGAEPPQAKEVRLSTRKGYAAAGGAARRDEATFANGDGTGPCQVCHTRTARWSSAASADPIHLGDCAFCHRHQTGFQARCEDCHSTPPATGAHAAHQVPNTPAPPFPSDPRLFGCGTCHPTDPARHGDGVQQILLNPDLVLLGGTRTTGAQATGLSSSTSCFVGCHHPLGAPVPSQGVGWSTPGPLPCTSCHTKINPGGAEPTAGAGPSLHDPVFSEARPASGEPTTCWSCHDSGSHDGAHLTGDPALVSSSSAIDAVCIACHTPPAGPSAGPQGQVLHRGDDAATARTPPILPGWSTVTVDSTSGDFHGGRRGTCFSSSRGPVPCASTATPTGYGGTLKAPYTRGYPAMPCSSCHATHASDNGFLFAGVVNGAAIPPGSIDRAGVGAEKLCEACHEGGRHDRCVACHQDPSYPQICDDLGCYNDPAAPHVDPSPPGSACFWCHGHEGILQWTEPYSGSHYHGNCNHCHQFRAPATEYAPPAFASGGAPHAGRITGTEATVSWTTNENASSYVEWGVGMPGYVAGTPTPTYFAPSATAHSVTLSGLTPGTTYVWRVRSADWFRNVTRSPLATFTTSAPGAVPYPDVIAVGSATVPSPATTSYPSLRWYPVVAPSGNAVEYRVQLATDPTFATLVDPADGSPPDSGWIPGTPSTLNGTPILYFQVTLSNLPQDDCGPVVPTRAYYWRVKARDSVTGVESDWSAVDPFVAGSYQKYC
jgi:hypothetical protein